MTHHLFFGARRIDFSLQYGKRKSLSIKVYPNGEVTVSAPLGLVEAKIQENIKNKAPWILKQQDQFSKYRPLTPPRRFISGETHLLLGQQYKLKVVQQKQGNIKAYSGQLWMYAPNTSPDALQKQLRDWHKNKASVLFKELFEKLLPKFNRFQIGTPVLMIRLMKKRWGSCTPSGKILLNLELIKAPKGCIEYVILHELCHLVYPHHGKLFGSLLEKMMPNWKKWKQMLEHSLL